MQLFQYDETDIMMSSRDSFFTADHVVNEGLMFAFGMTGFDDITESIEDPTIGQLKPYYKSWGILDEEAVDSDFEPLRYHTCTREELRLEDDPTTELPPSGTSTQFYPIKKEGTQVDLDYYYKKLKCLDQDQQIEVQGDYNSAYARSVILLFERCTNSTYTGEGACKSDEYITEWLKRKFVLVAQNNERFSSLDYAHGAKVVSETVVEWLPINTQVREELVMRIQLTELYL